MSSEGVRPRGFYPSTKYLSPLERKRLRAIGKDPTPAPAEDKNARTPSKGAFKVAAGRQAGAKKEVAQKKRKRNASSPSNKLTEVRPKTKPAPSKAAPLPEAKSWVIPLSEKDSTLCTASSVEPELEPPAKKARKFFSSGLRASVHSASKAMPATVVSWNGKFKLEFKPAVTTKKEPKAAIKRELAMTMPLKAQAGSAPTQSSKFSLPEQDVCDVPEEESTKDKQAEVGKENNHTSTKSCEKWEVWMEKGSETQASAACKARGRSPANDIKEDSTRFEKENLPTAVVTGRKQFSSKPKRVEPELVESVITVSSRDSSACTSTLHEVLDEDHHLPLKALCTNVLCSGDGEKEAAEQSATPPPSRSGSPRSKTPYPIFSTPTSDHAKRELCKIPMSPIEVPKKKFLAASLDPNQLIIDAGQKKFGHTTCSTCGMVYTLGDAEDEKLHTKHHNSFLAVVKFPGWKNQREVGIYLDGKVIMVSPNDPKCMLNKMNEIRQMVDRELGIVEDESATHGPQMYFVFVSYDKRVLGFLSAQEIKEGYRVIPDDSGRMKNSFCCEREPVKAVCGISRIWTAPCYRRKRVASRLLDRLRLNFSFGCPIDLREIAFSDPTLMGRELAAAYTQNDRFLVYHQ
ncbi:establishment of cohesion [Amblyomma americanum]